MTPLKTVATRTVPAGRLIVEPIDWFDVNGIDFKPGVLFSALTAEVFFNNQVQAWPVVNGAAVADTQVTAGKLYFHEFQTGHYTLRTHPNAVGLWRIILTWASGNQGVSIMYDVENPAPFAQSLGLQSSFIKRH